MSRAEAAGARPLQQPRGINRAWRLFGSHHGDLDEQPRIGELCLDAGAPGQVLAAGPRVPGFVHRVAMANVAHPDGGAHDLALVGAAQRQQPIDLLEDLLRLTLGVLLGIVGGDSSREHETVGLDDLRENLRGLVALDGHCFPPGPRRCARAGDNMAEYIAPFAMKIDAVELTLFAWDDIPPTRYTQGTHNISGRSNLGLLRIKTDDGVEGHAFLGSAVNPAESDAGALIRFLKPVLMGKDPLAREDLHAAMRARQRHLGLRAIGACDTALWDIAAKAAGMPLYRFLGGGRSAIAAYASSQVLESREAYAAQAAQFKTEGWKAYKIHPP